MSSKNCPTGGGNFCYHFRNTIRYRDRQMIKSSDEIPYSKMPKWEQTARFLINKKQNSILGQKSDKENWQQQLADELHRPVKRNFIWRRVIANHVDEIWCADSLKYSNSPDTT